MSNFLPEFPFYCGELWEKFEAGLKERGFEIEVIYLRPPADAEPAGKPRLVLLRQEDGRHLQVFLSYDNYLSEQRAPRSQDAFFLIYGR
ncbi:MAG: hypothetical protein NUV70_05695 [Caldiserica bacterium]|jgi:hypothetical protein|nr:hypothetical protein [Caldisericota bacterium]